MLDLRMAAVAQFPGAASTSQSWQKQQLPWQFTPESGLVPPRVCFFRNPLDTITQSIPVIMPFCLPSPGWILPFA